MEKTNEVEHMTQISFRIPKNLKKLAEKIVAKDYHVNISDYFREALRDKIKNEVPSLYNQIFKEA